MFPSFRSIIAVLALSAAAFAAQAQTYSGTISWQSDPGDYLGMGGSGTYSEGVKAIGNTYNAAVAISYFGTSASGSPEWFTINLAAPYNQPLQVGRYDGATRYPFNAPGTPGLDVGTTGRGCNTGSGSFVIDQVKYGPRGYVETIVGSFEYGCDYSTGKIRGTFAVFNPPPPPALAIELALDTKGYVNKGNGEATISGVIACTSNASVFLNGTVVQPSGRFGLNQGWFGKQLACTPEPAQFTVSLVPLTNGGKYEQGPVQIDVKGSSYDAINWNFVESSASTVGHLVPVK
jgi:hypothetical protein